ncbi:MAG: SMP-30/gluconolactonase/LRE family protein [Candidatus Competibacteraceae bacterium]
MLLDDAGARVVADGLGYTNECVVHPNGKQLYVNETFTRRLTRFKIATDGSLHNKATITEFGAGTFPDGLTFDAEGGIWITSIVSNRVIRVEENGRQTVVLEDNDPGASDVGRASLSVRRDESSPSRYPQKPALA